MRHLKNIFSIGGFIALLFTAALSSATMVRPSSTQPQQPVSVQAHPTPPLVQSGVISAIDVAQHTIMVGKTAYMFVAGLTRVRSFDPLINGNPLQLKVGQVIEFITITEANGKQRITDIAVKK